MLTAFDVVAAVLLILSALLATARGATREVLSLASWAGAGIFAFWAWTNYPEFARGYIEEQIVADIVTVVVAFLVSLIVFHVITMRIADFVVDSKIGPLDRTLGFVFGAARGVVILLVFIVFLQWLLPDVLRSVSEGSRALPTLNSMADDLIAALPEDLEQQVNTMLQRGAPSDAQPETPPLDEGTDAPEQPIDDTSNI
jgi:membrane protein required for colicin V production